MELTPKEESARSVISLALPASDQPRTVFLVLQANSSTRVDVGLNVPPFPCRRSAKTPPALTPVLTLSSRYLKLNAPLVLLSAPLAQDLPITVPHVFMDQSQSMVAVPPCAVRTSTVSKDSVLLAQLAATDAETTHKAASAVLKDT